LISLTLFERDKVKLGEGKRESDIKEFGTPSLRVIKCEALVVYGN